MGLNSVASLLTSVDSLFTIQTGRDEAKRETVMDIPLAEISDFPKRPFKVRMDESMTEMADSVKQNGVLVPALVRPKSDGGYEMIVGHRRKMASELAGTETLCCIVRDLTDDEAIIVMVDSNLQREQIFPSEKAFAYKMKMDAMNRQAVSPSKNILTPLMSKKTFRTNERLAVQVGESWGQIRRYIRLTHLVPEMLDIVDSGKIALRPAVELSYLTEDEQQALLNTMACGACSPSRAQAIKMRQFSQKGKLNEDALLSIMQAEEPDQKKQLKIPKERVSRFFEPGTPAQKIEDTIIKALEFYHKRQRDKASTP